MHRTASVQAIAANLCQQVCAALLVAAALALALLSGAMVLGLAPWPEVTLAFAGAPVPHAGMWAQLGVTALVLSLLGVLPANARVRRLEVTARDFRVGMDDVARAYAAAHGADRDDAFRLGREFDAMRERMEWMRRHPVLSELEPDVLQLAGQMSVESRALAEVYSAERVERARGFLRQRQREVEDYRERVAMAQATVTELRRWMGAVGTEEGLAERQLERLRADLAEITDAMRLAGHDGGHDGGGNVVRMGRRDGEAAAAAPAE